MYRVQHPYSIRTHYSLYSVYIHAYIFGYQEYTYAYMYVFEYA